MCKAVIKAHATDTEGDLSRSDANRLSRQLNRGAEQTGGATAEFLRRNRPDQPKGTKPRREPDETNEAQTPLNPRTPRDPIMQAFKKRQKDRLQRATHGDAPPIFPDPMDAEMNEGEEKFKNIFPTQKYVLHMTRDLSPAQLTIFNRAMTSHRKNRRKSTGGWMDPPKAKKLAQRIADSILYERDERRRIPSSSPGLIKSPRYGSRTTRAVKTVKKHGSLTGSDSYRPTSIHATLVKNQPW